jgi:hypothetical protein
MVRNNLPLDPKAISIAHANNTLIIKVVVIISKLLTFKKLAQE